MTGPRDIPPASPIDDNCVNPLIAAAAIDNTGTQHGKKEQIETTEELYRALGNPGLYAKMVFALVSINMFTAASNHAAGVFLDYGPDHLCTGHGNYTHVQKGVEPRTVWNTSYPPLHDGVVMDKCSITVPGENRENLTRKCLRGEWTYIGITDGESSSVTEWDLVCDRSSLAHLSSTLYFGGVMLGGLLFGPLSDVVGRRVAMIISLYLSVGLGISIALTDNLVVYIVLRALMGLTNQGLLTATYIRLLELFGPRLRGFAGNGLYFVWGLALNYLGFVAWLIKDWRFIQIACIAQGCLCVFYIWVVPESLRWLIVKGKTEKAKDTVRKIYKINRCKDERCLDPTLLHRLTADKGKHSANKPSNSIIDLLRHPTLKRRTFVLGYITFAVNVGYWGFTYNTQSMVGNRYQNFILSTIPEIFVYATNIYIMSRFGRKRPMMFYFFVAAFCSLLVAILLSAEVVANSLWLTAITTIGRLAACGLMGTNDVFMAELYPTVLRNTGVGVCICVGRIGALITPTVFSFTEVTFQGMPLIVVGAVTALAVLATLFLPDTWQQELPETIHDLEMTIVIKPPGNEDMLIVEKPSTLIT